MPAVLHAYSNAVADFTGTITGFDSRASTITIAATNLVRPVDWNSGHNQLYTLAGNTNNASTGSGSNIVLSGGNNITLIGSNSVIGISAPAERTFSGFDPYGLAAEPVSGQQGAGTLHIAPVRAPAAFQFDRAVMPLFITNTSNSSNSHTLSMSLGIYTRNGSTLSLLTSVSSSYGMTASGTQGSYSLWGGGVKNMTLGLTTTLTAGDYYLGVWSRTTTGGGGGQTLNQLLVSYPTTSYSGVLGVGSNATDQLILGLGRYSVSFSTAMPNSIGFTEIQGVNSILLRPPLVRFESGTI